MRKDQEARILQNQILIMRAISMLLVNYSAGRGAVRNAIDERINDTENFIRERL